MSITTLTSSEEIEQAINLPKHIAIIMDGNNRYGKAHKLAVGGGHTAGRNAFDPIVEYCANQGVKVLTVFAFSSENWQRPEKEVAILMKLLEQTILSQIERMTKNQISLRFIGERNHLPLSLRQLMERAESQTAHFTRMSLVIAVSYGGQWDITNAAKQLALEVQAKKIDAATIKQEDYAKFLALSDLPAVDMLIRTGGDYRISNFLLWQSAYAELFFTETLWPDFTSNELEEMIAVYMGRERRFGKTSEQVLGAQ